jgi:hypothetical protein
MYDLVLCYKIQHRLIDTELYNALPRSASITARGHLFKLYETLCSIYATKYLF